MASFGWADTGPSIGCFDIHIDRSAELEGRGRVELASRSASYAGLCGLHETGFGLRESLNGRWWLRGFVCAQGLAYDIAPEGVTDSDPANQQPEEAGCVLADGALFGLHGSELLCELEWAISCWMMQPR